MNITSETSAAEAAELLNATKSIDLPDGATILEERPAGDIVKLATGQKLRRWTTGLSTDEFGMGGIGWDEFADDAEEMGDEDEDDDA